MFSRGGLVAAISLLVLPWTGHDLGFPTLYASAGFSLIALVSTMNLVPLLGPTFVERNLKGRDRLKRNQLEMCLISPLLFLFSAPESMGLICASIYALLLTLFIPFLFTDILRPQENPGALGSPLLSVAREQFPHQQLSVYLSALLCLLSATILGFLDDVFDIRWRYKLPIPLIASIPLLLVYHAEHGNTHIVLPKFIRNVFGHSVVDLGPLYYLYMSLLSTFCTNSINILAGINGIEASQALIIALSIALNDLLYLPLQFSLDFYGFTFGGVYRAGMALGSRELVERHLLSLYFMLPLIGVCIGFLRHNWYPARAFPGDTFCYFAGMAFAVVGIIGHFSKTLLLFFIPQIFNFLLSCPQLFGLVPCPRHRMPRLGPSNSPFIYPSTVDFEHPPRLHTRLILSFLSLLGFTRLTRHPKTKTILSATNLTLLNTVLVVRGPMSEERLTLECMALQVAGSMIAFGIRYGLAGIFYDGDRR
ncbi:hypothetical protein BS47DRAFT_1376229 [Hydnum rufescens UP504]|uniref:UDP-N-acetylglucosamine--dolichyl-phosphate N-acetylglucosaminephosphotransferase n=1 Tax=Hydnum rufescens UP504 TaxID=1448309 RepID=A0A9P6B0Y6_9AGAM|nr:hypothetical protein BS47DRAFT_1376229 [Hydnum rufescens UP504]